jgi:predicted metal-binding membrane protein
VALEQSAFAELLGHEAIEHHGVPLSARLAAFLLSWLLMTVAMMLPGSLPALNTLAQSGRAHLVPPPAGGSRFAGLLLLGYLSPWILAGLLFYLGDGFIHQVFGHEGPLVAYAGWVAPAILLAAGLYQFTPAKRGCSQRCRPAHTHVPQGRADPPGTAAAWQQGLRLGLFCVGSCWALMLLMFALGHDQPGWMLTLGGIMAAERLAPWGQRLTWLVGIVLVVWAVLWALI